MDGEFCLFSGDVSNGITNGVQDGIIDTSDFDAVETSLSFFITEYNLFDLTGDGIVESSDYSLIGTNAFPAVFVMKP